MISAARRQFMQVLGFAPFAGNSALKEIAGRMGSAEFAAMGSAVLSGGHMQPAGLPDESPAHRMFGKTFARLLSKLRERGREENYAIRELRRKGLDPDIAALKSCSYTYLARKQFERDVETIALTADYEEKLWG